MKTCQHRTGALSCPMEIGCFAPDYSMAWLQLYSLCLKNVLGNTLQLPHLGHLCTFLFMCPALNLPEQPFVQFGLLVSRCDQFNISSASTYLHFLQCSFIFFEPLSSAQTCMWEVLYSPCFGSPVLLPLILLQLSKKIIFKLVAQAFLQLRGGFIRYHLLYILRLADHC